MVNKLQCANCGKESPVKHWKIGKVCPRCGHAGSVSMWGDLKYLELFAKADAEEFVKGLGIKFDRRTGGWKRA